MTERTATGFGIGAIVVMSALLFLVAFRAVPAAWDLPLFLLALVLFAVRLAIRTIVARRRTGGDSSFEHPPS